jgi:chorismate synthase
VEVPAFGADFQAGSPDTRAAELRPKTPWHARVSNYHQVAEALILGKIDKGSFVEPNLRNPKINALADKSQLRTLDPRAEQAMVARIDDVKRVGNTLGGVCEVIATGVPVGLGSHVSWDRKLDGRLAAAMLSIPAVKGMEIGLGFESARRSGAEVHDEMEASTERALTGNVRRRSNNAGGLEGGMTTGEPLVLRVAMKPLSTLMRPLQTVDTTTGQAAEAVAERSDVTAVPAMGVIAEAMTAFVLAQAMLEKFGGDSLGETRRNYDGYIGHLRSRER